MEERGERSARACVTADTLPDSADHAGDRQRNHHTARDVQMFAIGSCAGIHSHPKSDRVRRIGGDRRNAAE